MPYFYIAPTHHSYNNIRHIDKDYGECYNVIDFAIGPCRKNPRLQYGMGRIRAGGTEQGSEKQNKLGCRRRNSTEA